MYCSATKRFVKNRSKILPKKGGIQKKPPIQGYFLSEMGKEVRLASAGVELESQELIHNEYKFYYGLKKIHLKKDEISQEWLHMLDGSPAENTKKVSLPAIFFETAWDSSLAIELTDNEPKVFFATPERVQESNLALQNNGSELQLVQDKSQALDFLVCGVPHFPGEEKTETWKRLYLTRPSIKGTTDRIGEASDCAKFAQNILGFGFLSCWSAIMGNAQSDALSEETAVPIVFGYENIIPDFILNYRSMDPALLKNYMKLSIEIDLPYLWQQYLSMQHKSPEKLEQHFQKMGMNQWANPEIGEGFRMFGIDSSGLPLRVSAIPRPQTFGDYLKNERVNWEDPSTTSYEHVNWNMHNAGVIAKADIDYITLENHVRELTPYFEVVNTFKAFYCQYEKFREVLEELLASPDNPFNPLVLSDRINYIRRADNMRRCLCRLSKMNAFHGELQKKVENLAAYDLSEALATEENKLFYLRMYGREPRQSFFEKRKELTEHIPMTIRTRMDFELTQKKCLDIIKESEKRAASRKAAVSAFTGNETLDRIPQLFFGKYLQQTPKLIQSVNACQTLPELKRAMQAYEEFKRESLEVQVEILTGALGIFGLAPSPSDIEYINRFFYPSWEKALSKDPDRAEKITLINKSREMGRRVYWSFHDPEYKLE
ncbi:MAG: hypothetical protein MI784_01020 [Cytophagales bacterium]|nr:hypothetical protein [Cytophagales bacterium]